jgi:hypothetical protein
MRGQPAQQPGVVPVFKLVERVQHEDAAHAVALRLDACLGQPDGEGLEQVVVGARKLLGVAGPAFDLGENRVISRQCSALSGVPPM